MSNVLKMELFRFRKSKCIYIILIALSVMFLFGIVIDSTQSNGSAVVRDEKINNVELYVEDYDQTYTVQYTEKFEMLVSSFSGNIVAMSIIIFAGFFAGSYRKNKFEKNIVGLIGKRQTLVISNIIICAIYSMIIMCVTLIVSLIGYHILYPNYENMPAGDPAVFVKFLITYYILLNSVAIIMSCFVQVIGNQIVAIIVGLIYGSGIVYGIIDLMGQVLKLEGFSIEKYVPLGILYNLSIHEQSNYGFAIIIGVFFSVIAVIINIIIKNNHDIVT